MLCGLTATLALGGLLPAPRTRSAPTHLTPYVAVKAAGKVPLPARKAIPVIPAFPLVVKPPEPPAVYALPTPTALSPAPGKPLVPLPPPAIHASSAILVDAISGQVLYERNADEPRPMASTTKIMTALLFCERLPETAMLTASKHASEVRESSLHLQPGERVSAHDMLRAILMRSANDACVCAGENIAGSETAFVALMNERARQLGATRTHFMNPHGLQDKQHYTTARDLALIARAAVLQPRINEVTQTQKCRITRAKGNLDVTMRNHSHFLGHFPGADGIKTGWTRPAGHCYIGSATQRNWRLISVVLNSPDYVNETAALMQYGFASFAPHVVARAGEQVGVASVTNGLRADVVLLAKQTVQVVFPVGKEWPIERQVHTAPLTAPFSPHTEAGQLAALVRGRVICSTPLVPAMGVLAQPAASPAAIVSRASRWSWWRIASLFALSLVSLRYGKRYGKKIILGIAALAKGPRRRRGGVAPRL